MGYRIKAVRESKGITQEELARRSNVSRTIIWGLETGNRDITTTKTLCKIAEVLETTIDELFYIDSDPTE